MTFGLRRPPPRNSIASRRRAARDSVHGGTTSSWRQPLRRLLG